MTYLTEFALFVIPFLGECPELLELRIFVADAKMGANLAECEAIPAESGRR